MAPGRLSFVDPQHGWVVAEGGDDGSDTRGLSSGSRILATSDAGLTWREQYAPRHQPGRFALRRRLRGRWAWLGGRRCRFSRRHRRRRRHLVSGYQQTPTGESLRDVSFVDASHGWAVGDNGVIVATADGGTHWTTQAVSTDASVPTRDSVEFLDPWHGWAAGSCIASTSDGGIHWEMQRPPRQPGLNGIVVADAMHGWAVGRDGVLATTTGGLVDSVPPTTAVNDPAGLWRERAARLSLTATDNEGGSGMTGGCAATIFGVDGGHWAVGTQVMVPAPTDHANDGLHTVRYRSTDAVGNAERIQNVKVYIDTQAPGTSVPDAQHVSDAFELTRGRRPQPDLRRARADLQDEGAERRDPREARVRGEAGRRLHRRAAQQRLTAARAATARSPFSALPRGRDGHRSRRECASRPRYWDAARELSPCRPTGRSSPAVSQ